MAGGILLIRRREALRPRVTDRTSVLRLGQLLEPARGGGDHPAGHPLPAPEPPRRLDQRLAGLARASPPASAEPAVEPLGDRLDRPLLDRERESAAPTSGGQRRRRAGARPRASRSGRPRPAAPRRRRPRPRPSRRPRGRCSASPAPRRRAAARPPRRARAGRRTRPSRRPPARPRRSPAGGSARKAERIGSGSSSPALEPPPEPGDLARVVEVAAVERREQPAQPVLELAEAGDQQPRPGVLGVDQRPGRRAAGRRPWRRSACRRRRPAGRRVGVLADRGAASAVAPEGRPRGARPAGRRRQPPRASSASRGAEPSMSTPGGPSRVFASRPTSGSAAQRLSAVWREPTRTPRPPPSPRRRRGGSVGLRLDRVLEGRAVDLGREGATPARARIAGPITRWLASAASIPPARAATRATAATLASR